MKNSKPPPVEGMVIIGVDPGLRVTGYGVVVWTAEHLHVAEAGVIRPQPREPLPHRLSAIHQALEGILCEHHPAVMVLETLFAHPRHPRTVSVLGHVRGVICLAAVRYGVAVHEMSPKRVRAALLGRGGAVKHQIRRNVSAVFGLREKDLTLDTSDALALVLGWVRMNEGPSTAGPLMESRQTIKINDP